MKPSTSQWKKEVELLASIKSVAKIKWMLLGVLLVLAALNTMTLMSTRNMCLNILGLGV